MINNFYSAIRFRVVGSAELEGRSLDAENLFPEIAQEEGITVGDDEFGHPMKAADLCGKPGSKVLSRELCGKSDEVDIF